MSTCVVNTNSANNGNIEAQLVLLLERLDEASKREGNNSNNRTTVSMITEVRTLELWRAVIAECLAMVFYVFLVCGAFSPWTGKAPSAENHIIIALVAGFSMAVLVHSFGQVSLISMRPRPICYNLIIIESKTI